MCKLSDQDLRTPTIKSMAGRNTANIHLTDLGVYIEFFYIDFMWNAIKDPLDSPVAFDADGLDLAFKYFTSSTLTMR